MNKLRRINKGGTIGVICPSFSIITPLNVDNLTSKINELGYNVKYGKTCFLKDGYLAGSDIDRTNDIHEMFLDNDVDAILCYKGGYGLTRILNMIDYDIIKNNPKLLIGFSDITALQNAMYKMTGVVSLHGPVGFYFTENYFTGKTKDSLLSYLDNTVINDVIKCDSAITYNKGNCEGILMGGNLTLIHALMGTPYEIDFTGKIIIIEDIDEEPFSIDRMLSSLRLSNSLAKASGYIIGNFKDCTPADKRKNDQTINELIDTYFKDLNIPIITNYDIGHDLPMISLPIGQRIQLDTEKKEIKIIGNIYE